jgi:hypothetical protein
MQDERVLLEHRIAWLEREMVRLIWTAIGVLSFVTGGLAYAATVNSLGGLGAFGVAVVAWWIMGWYLKRHEFRGAPERIQFMDP